MRKSFKSGCFILKRNFKEILGFNKTEKLHYMEMIASNMAMLL